MQWVGRICKETIVSVKYIVLHFIQSKQWAQYVKNNREEYRMKNKKLIVCTKIHITLQNLEIQ